MLSPADPTRAPLLSFFGAVGTVTGSRFLVEAAGARLLIDCGLYQGLKVLRQRNWAPFPVDPASIDAVILTHAHVDHSGYLPALVRNGFTGPVHVTEGTDALCRIVLPDCGHLQEEEARYANRKGFSKHDPALPLFTEADARRSLDQLTIAEMGKQVELPGGTTLTFRTAGHILGSSTITLDFAGGSRLLCSGDLGRGAHPVLAPPAPPEGADVILIESTYGDREHLDENVQEKLAEVINTVAAKGGTVLIPAFAVDRTEVVLVHLRELMESGAIPHLPVAVDSPMALAALREYRRAIHEGWSEINPEVANGPDPLDIGTLEEARDVEASMALDRRKGPQIVISASGMATGGRVVHHLAAMLGNDRNAVVLVGFQAAGTRGASLAAGARELKMLGRYVPVRAEVRQIDGLSVHADASELVAWLRSASREPDTVYCVHGEPDALQGLRTRIDDELGWCAVVPTYRERVRLDPRQP